MRLVIIFVAIGIAVAILSSLYVRFAPSDPHIWHRDPRTVEDSAAKLGYLLRDDQPASGPAARYEASVSNVMTALDEIALATPRVERLAGNPESGFVTYIARSKVFGFPDYISIMADPSSDGTTISIYARQRFGSSDFGVNRQRVEAWLDAMNEQLGLT